LHDQLVTHCPQRAAAAAYWQDSPHVGQKLLQLLMAIQRPQLEVAGGVRGVADAFKQGPVLIEGETQAGGEG